MNSLVKVMPNLKKFNDYIFEVKKGTTPMMLSGLTDVGKIHMMYSTKFYTEKPICIVTYNEMQAKRIINDFGYFGENVLFFPKREITSFDYIAENKDLLFERISVLNQLSNGNSSIVVTTIEAVNQKMIKKENLYHNVIKLKVGDTFDLEALKEKLVKLGFERYDSVESKGQFSVRGGIVDIATSNNNGVRIEFWGDEVDSIRRFSLASQRTVKMLDDIEITPAYEFLLEKSIEEVCQSIIAKYEGKMLNDTQRKILEEDIAQIKEGNYVTKIDKYFDCFYEEGSTLLDYLPSDTVIFIDEVSKIKARCENIAKDNENLEKDLLERGKIIPEMLRNSNNYDDFQRVMNNKQVIYLEKQDVGFVDIPSMHAKRNGYSFSYREVNFFRGSMDLLFQELQEGVKAGKQIVILGGNTDSCKKLSSLLFERSIINSFKSIIEDDLTSGEIIITPGCLSTGFELFDANLLVISSEELFENTKARRRKLPTAFKDGEKIIFEELKEGDYVVHRFHGIGQYVGVNTIKADKITKDYIKLKYKDDDILYVPTNALDNIRKYIGPEKVAPRLNRLGSKEWDKTKAKVKNNLREVAEELIRLYAKRQKMEGYAFSKDTPWQKEFEDKFEYAETDDQLRCIEEIKKDMEKSRPMDRLLCGDVGYGKTEVAIRAAFKAVMDQKQVVYLVPTTILATQQYEEFKDRMKDYPINIELLNRFRTKKEQDDILKRLELGEVDILIGTHRVLSKDVKFRNLGLLIIDEEHRFGVKAKEKIKSIKEMVDVLTMTATPIPRTLNMSVVGMRDMSVIYEPPQNRKPVQTYVLEYDEEVIREAITKELEKNGQVFYLYNNVEGIEKKASEISSLVEEAKVEYAHGQMSGKQLEDIMQDFVDGKSNVLVCTTILESGIDIPNANTIIVENADRLGLAQLYQIRGRVGRSDRQAYAYITYKRNKNLSEVADKRLKAIKEFTEFGSGFKIAMRDLEIRGAGSLLGEIQHGHMEQIGYDMYTKLLDEVVKEIKGEEIIEEIDVQIDLDVTCYVPDEYVQNSSQKIEIYQNIALCKNEKDIEDVIDEIIDRYGKMPYEIETLIEIARIKNLAREHYILKIMQKQESIVFYFDKEKFNLEVVDKLLRIYRSRIRFSPSNMMPYFTIKMKNKKDVIKEAKEFLGYL